ncbi:hypothetical protein, partial [Mesorhizobium japonicum]|uniref:hypothetical protein n=1 Tax=Mesorhizobium japonicum TaxID=2066070 RepID=UPI003B5C5D53
MQLPSSDAPWTEVRPFGKYFLDLLENRSWSVRRVTTIHPGVHQIGRRVSLDVDAEELTKRARDAGLRMSSGASQVLPVPLGILAKGTLLDIDSVDQDDHVSSIAPSDRDSMVAMGIMAVAIERAGIPTNTRIRKVLHHIASDETTATLSQLIAVVSSSTRTISDEAAERGFNAADFDKWKTITDDSALIQLLVQYARSFIAITRVAIPTSPDEQNTMTLKHRLIEPTRIPERRPFWEAIGWRPMYLSVATPSLGFSSSDHLRIEAPNGSSLVSAALARSVTKQPNQAFAVAPSKQRYQRALTTDRAVAHARKVAPGDYS